MGIFNLRTAIILAAFVFAPISQAYEDDETHGYINANDPAAVEKYRRERLGGSAPEALPLPRSGDRWRKFNLALDTIGVPRETPPTYSDFPHANQLNLQNVRSLLPYIDPERGLRKYMDWTGTQLKLFLDFFTLATPLTLFEFGTAMESAPSNSDSPELMNRLAIIAEQAKIPGNPKPLAGLRVVIDPGHMGGETWDELTGKFVKIGSQKVSEGEIALWTSLRIAQELEALGAIVTLTRAEVGTVSHEDPANFDVAPYYNDYFHRSLDTWMAPYLKLSDENLKKTIKTKPEVKRASTSAQKMQFYIGGADLEARSRIVDESEADVFLDIHYDANMSNQLQSRSNSIEAFVPGGFGFTEVASRKSKQQALKHLLEVRRFNESVDLSFDVIQAMSKSQKLPVLDVPEFLTSIRVKDGVYARSLYVNRRNLKALTVFLECLHYDHVDEFPQMARLDQIGTYQGMSFQYPSRIDDVVKGVRQGFLNYFQAEH